MYFCKKIKIMLPCICPSCQSRLKVKNLQCENCQNEFSGMFELPVILRLSHYDQQFIMQFVKCSGNLKDMAKSMNLSYPAVRNLMDDVVERMKKEEIKTN